MSMLTVGIVLISDDILSDRKNDCISDFFIKELTSLEFIVNKLTVIRNEESSVVTEINSLTKNCDIIIVISEKCGTFYRAIGNLMSQELQQSEELENFLNAIGEIYDKDETFLPIQAKILHNCDTYPIVHVQRIFLLKEKYIKQSFPKILKNHLVEYRKPRLFQKIIKVAKNGNSIADLNKITSFSNNSVSIEISKTDDFFIFQIISPNLANVVQYEEKIKETFEPYRLKFEDASEVWKNVYSSEEKHIKSAIESITCCIDQYDLDNIFMSFNGGKDCTVLLHLVLTVIKTNYPEYTKPIFCLYVQSDKPFPEQEEFISQAQSYYNLKIITIRSGIKEALEKTLREFPNYKACFMGTRRTDPYSSDLNIFQMTDSNWPQVMRVCPVLDWHYSDIWDYLLYYKVPYCSLYDLGFTSLGNIINTKRNPSLIYYDYHEKKEKYLPAYKLLTVINERNGRNSS